MALTPLRNLPARPWTVSVPSTTESTERAESEKQKKPRPCRGFPVAPSRCSAAGKAQCLASSLAALALASLATSRALSATFCAASAVASLACAAASVAATLAWSAALAVASAALSSACWVSAAACSEAAAVLSAASRVAAAARSTASRAATPALSAACCASCLACSASGPCRRPGPAAGAGQQGGGDRTNLHGGLRYCNGWGRQPIHAVVKTGSRSALSRDPRAQRKAAGEPAAFPEQREERSDYFLASSAASLACSAVASAALAASWLRQQRRRWQQRRCWQQRRSQRRQRWRRCQRPAGQRRRSGRQQRRPGRQQPGFGGGFVGRSSGVWAASCFEQAARARARTSRPAAC